MSVTSLFFIRIATYLENAKRYQKSKLFFKKLLGDSKSPLKFYFDLCMIFLVFASVFILLYEVKHPTIPYYFEWIVHFSLLVFSLEYLLRIWVSSDSHRLLLQAYNHAKENHTVLSSKESLLIVLKPKLDYMLTPLAIIDLLAILPSYRPLRFLRIFLLFRIFKLFRYARSIHTFSAIVVEKKFELITIAIFAGFIIFIGSAGLYIYETHDNPKINTLFDALYFSIITMGTIGYGDIVPQTHEGRIIAIILTVLGVTTIAFLTSIIVSSFQTKLSELKENRVFASIEKIPHYILVCGYGRVGEVIAKMLSNDGYTVVIVDNAPEQVALAQKRGLIAVLEDASKTHLLLSLGVANRASKIICATNSDEMNLFIALGAKSLNSSIEIIARVVKKSNKKKYALAGVRFAFNVDEMLGIMGLEYLEHPISYIALDEILTENTGVIFESIPYFPSCAPQKCSLDDLKLSTQKIILFGVLRNHCDEPVTPFYPIGKKHFYFNPPKTFVLEPEDMLIVIGKKTPIQTLLRTIEQRAFA